jgi:hypothetical protein
LGNFLQYRKKDKEKERKRKEKKKEKKKDSHMRKLYLHLKSLIKATSSESISHLLYKERKKE